MESSSLAILVSFYKFVIFTFNMSYFPHFDCHRTQGHALYWHSPAPVYHPVQHWQPGPMQPHCPPIDWHPQIHPGPMRPPVSCQSRVQPGPMYQPVLANWQPRFFGPTKWKRQKSKNHKSRVKKHGKVTCKGLECKHPVCLTLKFKNLSEKKDEVESTKPVTKEDVSSLISSSKKIISLLEDKFSS